MKHRDKLLDWFTRRESITPMEALSDLGIYRLGARIKELRDDGYSIRTELLPIETRDGGTARVARYHYEGAA